MSERAVYRCAYHEVILPTGEHVGLSVCTFDADGRFISCEPLRGEEPFVEWCGGVLNLNTN